MLTILFNQAGPTDGARFTGTYVAAKPAKPVPPRQRIALRGSCSRTACGVIALATGEPPDQPEGRQRGEEEEELVLLFALMG